MFLKNMEKKFDKPSVKIYVNKIKIELHLKFKNGYSLELLTPETMNLLGSTENKITKDKRDKIYCILKLQK